MHSNSTHFQAQHAQILIQFVVPLQIISSLKNISETETTLFFNLSNASIIKATKLTTPSISLEPGYRKPNKTPVITIGNRNVGPNLMNAKHLYNECNHTVKQ